MNQILENRIKELRNYSKNEDWYITKQSLDFLQIAIVGMQSLDQYKKYQNEHSDNIGFGDFYDKHIKNKSSSRFVTGAYYYGLTNDEKASNASPTEVSNEFQYHLNSIESILNKQIEKMRIPLPNNTSKDRETFDVFIAPTLYSILLNLEDGLTKEELTIFVVTIKKYSDYKTALECIKLFRRLDETEKNKIRNEFKGKFDVRIDKVFEQLSAICHESDLYYLEKNKVDEVTKKVNEFSEHLDYYENLSANEYKNLLESNVELWDAWNQEFVTEDYKNADNSLNGGINEIYVGAPGTGKSFCLEKNIEKTYLPNSDEYNRFVFRTTFYPDYSYYDFVGDIRPVKKENNITYDFVPGIFTRALLAALKNPRKKIYLIIEEMSRGNSESIFGDIFQLLDRDDSGESTYKIDNQNIQDFLGKNGFSDTSKIYIPSNMSIFGTVNSSDQNVYVLDTAFKRRFQFRIFSTRPTSNENDFSFIINGNKFKWISFYQNINKVIIDNLGLEEDKQIGQWFIKGFNDLEQNNILIKNKLLNYLWEDVDRISLSSGGISSIFNKKYKTFADIYNDFDKPDKQVFSDLVIDSDESRGNI